MERKVFFGLKGSCQGPGKKYIYYKFYSYRIKSLFPCTYDILWDRFFSGRI